MTTRRTLTRWIAPALIAAAGLTALPAAQAADVGVSIGFSQPGVYGRVDIGRYPQPVLIAPQPVIVGRPVYRADPVYLWVPPEHRRDWRRHCYHYGACGAPVYFVQDGWYQQNVYVHRGHGRGRDDWHDHHHGRGHGHGHGHRD
ncbi:hypothetical protein J2X20_002604 [Pelomonas saccharophila]|uniref:Uncharacterized protein n=1 Tax=Roseateles saccharophilus TaxID=304 RepID=A0ABU1YP21_ROSSA|nr:hypothetical protein [Roseateles saccharophilus]MDR7269946.1 hypothetical protein [Roseateles saccharophilus]